jgi:hypothetical protein
LRPEVAAKSLLVKAMLERGSYNDQDTRPMIPRVMHDQPVNKR